MKTFVFVVALTLMTASVAAQTTAPLDINSDTAIEQCSRSGGLAGWLSRIEPNGDYVGPADTYCVVPPTAETWHVDLGLDYGKAFSIVDGRFVASSIPSITLLFKSFEVHTASYFYNSRWFEHDTHLRWYQKDSSERRWSVFAEASHLKWPGGDQLTARTGVRWRLR